MRRQLITAAAATGALLLAHSPVSAATDITYSQDNSGGTPGAGTITASATADRSSGAMTADSSATGGGDGGDANPVNELLGDFPGGLLTDLVPGVFGPAGPSFGRGQVYVNGGEGLEAGLYLVTVTLTGADTDEAAAGSGTSRGWVSSEATYSTGGENFAVAGSRIAELPADPATIVLQYEIDLPVDAGVTVNAMLTSDSNANGEGNSATTSSRIGSTTFEIVSRGGAEPTDPPATTEPATTEPPATEPATTEPPVTLPEVTLPEVTLPEVTLPPVTEPPATEPPVTEPPATEPPATEPPTCVLGVCL